MGNKLILNPQIPQINRDQWEVIEQKTSQNCIYGEFRVLRNKVTYNLIDEYEVVFVDEDDFKIYLQSFAWRLKEPKIVRTLYLVENHKKQLCSVTYAAKVYIQHIKIRLSDIRDIPFPQNLYVALCMLQGYSKLYQHTTQFEIQENQVCIDDNGHVKIWINSDLSKNYPLYGEEGLNYDADEMVQDIIKIISGNTDRETEPYPLDQYFQDRKKQASSFQQALILISQYARQYKTKIPHCFSSILQIYGKNKYRASQQSYVKHQQKPMNNKQKITQIKNLEHEECKDNAISNSNRNFKLKSSSIHCFPTKSQYQVIRYKKFIQPFDQYGYHQKKSSNLVNQHQNSLNYNRNMYQNQYCIPRYKSNTFSNFRSQYINPAPPIEYKCEQITYKNFDARIPKHNPYIPQWGISPKLQTNINSKLYHALPFQKTIFQNSISIPIKKQFEQISIPTTKNIKNITAFHNNKKANPLFTKLQDDSNHLTKSQIIKQQQKIIQKQKQQIKRLHQLAQSQLEKNEVSHIRSSTQHTIQKQSIQSSINNKSTERYKPYYFTLSQQQELDPEIAADLIELKLTKIN